MKKNISSDDIENLLPQTQCGLCDYAGCKPYARALEKGEANIDRCLPGGVETLKNLGELLAIDPAPFIDSMREREKKPMIAVIKEDECIGCTKCIQACPVDAIFGSSKRMHSIIPTECTGCALCVEPCPMDCIVMQPITESTIPEKTARANLAKSRYQAHQQRLALTETHTISQPTKIQQRQDYIAKALARVKSKKDLSS
ncbi:MAG: RnfABCDGE type electron transport complex subunit B [Legionellales bacterium]|nr:RnfABCDGE type electron transport complex subunit B [Legionellales bacterium]